MQDMTSMLSRFENMSAYDIRLVSVSPSCVKIDQRVSLNTSYTIKKIILILNTEIQDLWTNTILSANEDYLLVCCMYSREQYNRQKDRLDVVIEDMGKWIPDII